MAFVRACIEAVVPLPLLGGSPENRRVIMQCIWRWISAGKNDKLRVSDVILPPGLHTTHFHCFSGDTAAPLRVGRKRRRCAGNTVDSGSDIRTQARYVGRWMLWLVLGFVAPLIRTHFYATDSEAHHSRTLYFRKPTWARIAR
jgi:hypothetical protein